MCLSILPLLIKAGSSFSTWLVVKTMILSPPQADQIPSMKFSSPDSVTSLSFLSSFFDIALIGSPSSFLSSFFFFFFSSLWPVRSREQSMSSITMIDLFDVSIKSLLNSTLFLTVVSSRSYTS
ncbi:hypothetical protein ERO13_A07G216850v2 [Gossypium hirsutum]|uniref:REJ domain-containing protein n=2 Tax=Gossypium TaxID=3633 RepID=A0A5J5V6T3_GOSBA|nr:hypothetical protein ES319_A07G235200v1 [Gossypium barbadense]KAG4193360.1 hypothetical protein ERO13_A07G216850v2 [Gossypium hirsutum]TYH11393.1 hypothetical protein ES288_A07G255000v1 [Gossypium darwinii]